MPVGSFDELLQKQRTGYAAARGTAMTASSTAASVNRPRPISVVVIDDDVRVREAISQTIALESDMSVVGCAGDAATAFALVEQTRPSVVLVDVLLPDEAKGLGLVEMLAERHGCTVIAISGRGGVRAGALAAGAESFVEKTGDIDALLDVIREAAAVLPTSFDQWPPGQLTDPKSGP